MTPEQIKASLAASLWVVEQPDDWQGNSTDAARRYAALASAVFDLVKPKPLVWVKGYEPDEWESGPYDVWCELGKFQVYYWSIVMGDPHETPQAAKAAAQAHADAAHWANTLLIEPYTLIQEHNTNG